MLLIADDKIPYLTEIFSPYFTVHTVPGARMSVTETQLADALLVRSITTVDEQLLQGSKVKFVGTATAGFDHLDTQWLDRQRIPWSYVKGVNAKAVAEYVVASIAIIAKKHQLNVSKKRAAVIGVGCAGTQVVRMLQMLGFEVLCNDPPRAANEPNFNSIALEECAQCDVICVHTPLIIDGAHPTKHLIDARFIDQVKPGSILINAGRGDVVDNAALLWRNDIHIGLDVWEHEPNINLQLMQQASVATPHIAGYSLQAKRRATYHLYNSMKSYFDLPELKPATQPEPMTYDCSDLTHWIDIMLKVSHIAAEMTRMQSTLLQSNQIPNDFEKLRRSYPLRHEFDEINLTHVTNNNLQQLLSNLGFTIMI